MKKRFLILTLLTLTSCSLTFGKTPASNSGSSSNKTSISSVSNGNSSTSSSKEESSLSNENSQGSTETSSSNEQGEEVYLPYSECVKVDPVVDNNAWSDSDTLNIPERGNVTSKTGKVNFFEINDTHGALDTNSAVSGMDKLATLMNQNERNTDYVNVINGDVFQGGWLSNKTRGAAFIDIINQMNFDAFVIGNHEFDWGLDVISQYKDGDPSNGELDAPFLGCNIYYKDTNTHPSWIDPYTIVNSNGYKVGIIGAIGEGQYSSISTDKAAPYEFKNTNNLIKKYAAELRDKKKCDVVVLSIHEYEQASNSTYAEFSGSERLDAIICGHTHQKIEEKVTRSDGYEIPVIQSNTKNITAGYINMNISSSGDITSTMSHKYISNYAQDSTIKGFLEKYSSIINEGESIIGYSSSALDKNQIGSDLTKYFNEKYNADASFINTSGIRGTIDAGNIKMSKLLEVFPFDNRVLKVNIMGSLLSNFINKNGGSLAYTETVPGKTYSTSKYYTIVVIDFVYTRYTSNFSNTTFYDTKNLMLDDYIEAVQTYYSAN